MDGHHVDDDSVSHESAIFVDGDISDGGDPVSHEAADDEGDISDGDIDPEP